MSSTGRSISASVVVMFVLLAALTTAASQEPQPTPAADATSAVPAFVSRLGLETRQVEPGVLVLRPKGGGDANEVVDLLPDIIGRDGSMWRFREDEDGRSSTLIELGEREPVPWKRYWMPFDGTAGHGEIDVAADGTIWLTLEKGVASYDGTAWTIHQRIPRGERFGGRSDEAGAVFEDADGSLIADLDIAADGSVWVARLDAGADRVEVLRFDGQDWLSTGAFEARVDTYGDLLDGGYSLVELAADTEGAWLARSHPLSLHRYQEGDWREVALPADLAPLPLDEGSVVASILGMRAAPDGTLWLHTRRPGRWGQPGLDHYDGSAWSGWHSVGDRPPESAPDLMQDVDAVAPDGGIWLRDGDPWRGCAGISRFMGTTRTHRFLADRCVHAIRITPDGDVWLTAGKKNNELSVTTKPYLILAEAVAGTG